MFSNPFKWIQNNEEIPINNCDVIPASKRKRPRTDSYLLSIYETQSQQNKDVLLQYLILLSNEYISTQSKKSTDKEISFSVKNIIVIIKSLLWWMIQ